MITNYKGYCLGCMNVLSEGQKCSCGFDESEYKIQSQWLPLGTILHDSILIGKVIGDGGFGITYIGLDLNLEKKVAVKEFFMNGYCGRNTQVSLDVLTEGKEKTEIFETNKKKYIEEARILAKFSDEPSVVTVNRFFKENNTAYIVMEYVEGKSLKDYVSENGTLGVNETLSNIVPVMNALDRMHSQHIYHRDISPDNIILNKNHGMKILDFGSAREKLEEYKTMTVVLKRAYSPIEQYETHGNQGPWTDIYSLCATMYYCITGKTPDSAHDRFMNDSMPTAHEINPSCDEKISEIIEKGMQVDAEERYQSIEELKSDLSEYAGSLNLELEKTSAAEPGKDNSKSKNKDHFVIKKKTVKILAALIAGIALLSVILISSLKGKKINDTQIIYLNYPENITEEQLDNAKDVINKRMSTVFGDGNYNTEFSDQNCKVKIDINENYYCSDTFIKKYLFRPARLSLVYSTDKIDESFDISYEDIASFSDDYYIELTDEAANNLQNKIEEWVSRTEPAIYTYNNLGADVYNYKEFDLSTYDPDEDNVIEKPIQPDVIVNRCICLMLDYDMWKAGDISNSDKTIIVSEICDNGKRIKISNVSDFDCIKMVTDYHFMNQDVGVCFDTITTFPVLWERSHTEASSVESIPGSGHYQIEPEYFTNKNIESVDVIFVGNSDGANIGDRYNFRRYLQDVFDELAVNYSIGRLANNEYSIVIRVPIEYAGKEYFSFLEHGQDDYAFFIGKMKDNGDIERISTLKKDYISSPIEFTDNKVFIHLKSPSEYAALFGESERADYEEFLINIKGQIYWSSDSSLVNYFIGEYDKENSQLVFSQSSYEADGSIPNEVDYYVRMINAGFLVNSDVNKFNYSYAYDQNSCKDYEKVSEPVEYLLSNRLRDSIFTDVKNKFAETLGAEPEIIYSRGLYTVTLRQSVTDNYANNITRILQSIIDAKLFEDNGIKTIYSQKFHFDIENQNNLLQGRIIINENEKNIEIVFWTKNFIGDEEKLFNEQLSKIIDTFDNGENFEGYTVEVREVKY